MTEEDELKIRKFYEVFSDNNELPVSIKPLLVVGNILYGETMVDLYGHIRRIRESYQKGWYLYYSYLPVIGLQCETIFSIDKNKKPKLIYFIDNDLSMIDEKATLKAYQKAREARFEHGESPE